MEGSEVNYKLYSLCYRCEHRAQFLERGWQPRLECGNVNSAVGGCYMYKPVKPIIFGKQPNDKRPITLGFFSARVKRSLTEPKLALEIKKTAAGIIAYWVPKTRKKKL